MAFNLDWRVHAWLASPVVRIRGGGSKGLGAAVAVAALVGVGATASPAAAQERVIDGGFEQTTCPQPSDGINCTNPFWTESSRQAFVCATPNGCDTSPSFNFPQTGGGWLQLGGENYVDPPGGPSFDSGRVTQSIIISEAPATLRFSVRFYVPSPGDTNTGLSVSIGVSEVFVLQFLPGEGSSTPAGYVDRAVDVSNFVGPGLNTLEFETFCLGSTANACGVFLIDDVSLASPDLPPVTPPTATPATNTPTTPSTTQAQKCKRKKRKGKGAAVAKCKKKKKKS